MDTASTTTAVTYPARLRGFLASLTYKGKHRPPSPNAVQVQAVETAVRHLMDGRSIEDANALASIDADDAYLAIQTHTAGDPFRFICVSCLRLATSSDPTCFDLGRCEYCRPATTKAIANEAVS